MSNLVSNVHKFDILKGIPKCPICFPIGSSTQEQELVDFCKQYFYNNLKTHDRTLIKPYELDIIIPERKLAIEFNRSLLSFYRNGNTIRLSFNENTIM